MKTFEKILKIIVLSFFVLAVFLYLYLPTLATTGKVRGNEAALIHCRLEIKTWKDANTNSLNFDLFKLSADKKRSAAVLLGLDFNSWVKTNFVWGSGSNREIVIVCGKEFDNVPKPAFWNLYHRNPAHAVAYSDGTAGLISPEQFTNLNLAGFVSLANLATNAESEFNIFK